ncbi:hypothetical protein KQI61_15375 [Anaerocolumna aminovalerica]|uniref:hypothetical protein n=1 Tax=Anaerocolumna aminovalerica TaxID=1527 RepID=UPI001C0EEE32|nr:hypothetical protein [Anaerocolumna aminovalerica]MBU5333579.1 hypothetical protein [Anaerocolumna aminovalerica]
MTQFAKTCAYANNALLNVICASEDVLMTDIGKTLNHGLESENKELIYEVAKRFSKYTKDEMLADANMNDAALSELTNVLSLIVDCCEENNWFR